MKSRVLNLYMACCLSLMHAILLSLYDCSEEGRTRTKVLPYPTASIRIQRLVGGCFSCGIEVCLPVLVICIHSFMVLSRSLSVICLRIFVIQPIRWSNMSSQPVHEAMTHFMNGVWSYLRTKIFIFPRGAAKGCSGEMTQHPPWILFLKATALVWVWTLNLKRGWAEIGMARIQAVKHH